MLFDLNDTNRSNSIGVAEFKRIVKDPSITGMSTEHMTDTYVGCVSYGVIEYMVQLESASEKENA